MRFQILVLTTMTASTAFAVAGEADSSRPSNSISSITRQVVFELTFSQGDLIWLGDPASPTALVYPKPEARPIATDMHVRTVTQRWEPSTRRYYREARIAASDKGRIVYGFTKNRERAIGTVDEQGRFAPNAFYRENRELLPTWPEDSSQLKYDPEQNALYRQEEVPGPVVNESLDFLPLAIVESRGTETAGQFAIQFSPATAPDKGATVQLDLNAGGGSLTIAEAIVPRTFTRDSVQLGSYSNRTGEYAPESDYRPGTSRNDPLPSATFTVQGELAPALVSEGERLTLRQESPSEATPAAPNRITIDGNFDDWRNVGGVDDPRGDLVPYLEYVPHVDLLELKVAHDESHIYLYARVAGQVGRSNADRGCSYCYFYMDVDRNASTGFLPTRDDDCYFGVDLGDDCEVQFEFVNNVFRKAFYGFCGLGGDENVLKQQVELGKSQYSRFDDRRVLQPNYKSEYTFRKGVTEITEDFKMGTSDTIQLAISPDGNEVEVVSALAGFLKDKNGRPTLQPGQTIDIAAGMECDGKLFQGRQRWAADSTPAIRGYRLKPGEPQGTSAR